MKKKLIFIIVGIILLISMGGVIYYFTKNKSFFLEDKYYERNVFIETELDDINELINKKESFVLFVYQPLCNTSANFEEVLKEFKKDNSISIYRVAFAKIKGQDNFKYLKYYPSFIIFNAELQK